MQDISIAVLSTVLVMIQPAYDVLSFQPIGRLGALGLGIGGCIGGLLLILPRLFRAET